MCEGTHLVFALDLPLFIWSTKYENEFTFGDLKKFAANFGWTNLDHAFTYDFDDPKNAYSKFYCRKVVDVFDFFILLNRVM
jgi:hypothetical protein